MDHKSLNDIILIDNSSKNDLNLTNAEKHVDKAEETLNSNNIGDYDASNDNSSSRSSLTANPQNNDRRFTHNNNSSSNSVINKNNKNSNNNLKRHSNHNGDKCRKRNCNFE